MGRAGEFQFLDFLADTPEIGVAENKCDHFQRMSLQWTMTDQVGHETREPTIDPYAHIQYALTERSVP